MGPSQCHLIDPKDETGGDGLCYLATFVQKLKDDDRLGDMRLVKKVNTDSGFNYL